MNYNGCPINNRLGLKIQVTSLLLSEETTLVSNYRQRHDSIKIKLEIYFLNRNIL